jgi:hypothetical protein
MGGWQANAQATMATGSEILDSGQARQISVPQSLCRLPTSPNEDKLPAAPIFARNDGSEWKKDA